MPTRPRLMLCYGSSVLVSVDAVFCDAGCGEAAAGGGEVPEAPPDGSVPQTRAGHRHQTVHGRRVSIIPYMHLEARVRCNTCSSISAVLGSHMAEFLPCLLGFCLNWSKSKNDIASR